MPSDLVEIGYVLRSHGLKGLVRVRAPSDALLGLARVFVLLRADRESGAPVGSELAVTRARELAIESAQRDGTDVLIKLAGVSGRDQADALKGATVLAPRGELPPPGARELYVADLVGCAVVDASGAALGTVLGTFDSGAHELLRVGDAAREFLLPFVDAMIVSVDLAARRIVCDPPEGLIDLDRPTPKKPANER